MQNHSIFSIKRLDYNIDTDFKLSNNKLIEYQYSLQNYSTILSDRDYNIFKHYINGTLKNISLSCQMLYHRNIFFEIDSSDSNEKYFIELKPKNQENTNIKI